MEWVPPERWGTEKGQIEAGNKKTPPSRLGHIQRLTFHGQLTDDTTFASLTPYFAKTLLKKTTGTGDAAVTTWTPIPDRAKWTEDFCKKTAKDSNWYDMSAAKAAEYAKIVKITSKSVNAAASPATATIMFNMPLAFALQPDHSLNKDQSYMAGVCGGFLGSATGNDIGGDTIYEKEVGENGPRGFHMPVIAAPGRKLIGAGAAFISIGSAALLAAVGGAF